MKTPALCVTLALVAAACRDVPAPTAAPTSSFEIVDGAHSGGNAHFYWLPPLVAAPSPTGVFDGSLSPVVRISDLQANTLLTEFTMTSGPGSETVRVSAEGEHYIANWHTNEFVLNDQHTYRIRVVVNETELGHADVDVVTGGRELKNVDTGEYGALLDGRTLAIKFRIEEGALPPRLTLVKVVTNNNGGTAVAADFTLSASGPTPISGAGGATSGASFQAGTYTLSETGPSGYSASAWSCAGGTQTGNQIALALAQSASCAIINDDIPPSLGAVFFGGSGDQRGSNIHRDGSDLYVSGTSGNTALLLRYGIPLGSPAWSATLPGTYFEGVTLNGSTVFGVGGALPPACGASDGVGGIEQKSALARYTTGGSLLGCQSTNYFAYRGGEGYSEALALGGNVYAVGGAENCGFGHGVFVLTKYDASGTLLSQATEPGVSFGGFNCVGGSHSHAVTELNGALYLAGQSNLTSEDGFLTFTRPVLMKYDTDLNRIWKRRPADYPAGVFLGMAALGSHIYAVGQQYTPGVANSGNYLIEKYDEFGNRVWSRISGGALNDALTGVVARGGRLFTVGYTYSSGAGGADAVILEIDPATGNTLSTTLFGGAQDDLAQDVVTDGTVLYVVGESRSFATAGNAVGQNDVMVLRYVPGP